MQSPLLTSQILAFNMVSNLYKPRTLLLLVSHLHLATSLANLTDSYWLYNGNSTAAVGFGLDLPQDLSA